MSIPVYRSLSGSYNPSYITNSFQQSAVDVDLYFGEEQKAYLTTVYNDSLSSLVTTTAYTFNTDSRNVIGEIILSGSTLIFAGSFANDINNRFEIINWDYPLDSFNYLNIGYFDSTSNRIKKFKNIGNFTYPTLSSGISANSLNIDRVYCLSLCGNNLIAGGSFSLINTEITGFQNLVTTVPYAAIESLSSYGPPFNANIVVNQIITAEQYKLLADNSPSIVYTSWFFPTVSGDACTNIAYYDNNQGKWLPFNSTKILSQRVRSVAVRNDTVYATGKTDNGAIFYHDGSDWKYLSNSWSMSSLTGNFIKYSTSLDPRFASFKNKMEGLSLNYAGYNDRLVYTGIFSGYDSDYRKTGIMSYDFNNNSFINVGSGIDFPGVYTTVLCGTNICAFGPFVDVFGYLNQPRLAAYIELNGTYFKSIYNNSFNYIYGTGISVYTACLCGTNLVFGGKFQELDNSSDQNASFVSYIDKLGNYNTYNVLPTGPFSNYNPYKTFTTAISSYIPVVRKVFDYIRMNYTIGTGISGDFTSLNLYNNENILSGDGIATYGTSTYLGISGIQVDF
jgi:hypothetical protein